MNTTEHRRAGRPLIGTLGLVLLLTLISVDLLTAEPIDPYTVPYPVALGSGQPSSGAHCTIIPVQNRD